MPTLIEIWNRNRRPTICRLDRTGERALILGDAQAGIVNLWVRVDRLNVGQITHAGADTRATELETDLERILAALPVTPILRAQLEREFARPQESAPGRPPLSGGHTVDSVSKDFSNLGGD
jgi:hypothetical protein